MGGGFFVGIIFIILGILIRKFKLVGFLKLFNTREKGTFVDTDGLAKFCGNGIFVSGLGLILITAIYYIFAKTMQSQFVLNLIELSAVVFVCACVFIIHVGSKRFENVDSFTPWVAHVKSKIFRKTNL